MKNRCIRIILAAIAFVLLGAWPVFASGTGDQMPDLTGKRIGVQTGTTTEQILMDNIKDVQLLYYESSADMLLALRENRIDAFAENEPNLRRLASLNGDITVYRMENVEFESFAPFFARSEKGRTLKKQYDDFYAKLKSSGEADQIINKWLDRPEEELRGLDYGSLPGTNGTLQIATDPTYPPFEYIRDNQLAGLEMEIMVQFCKEYGYRPEFSYVAFTGIVSGVSTGKFDIGAGALAITEERSKNGLFGTPFFDSYVAVAVPLEGAAAAAGGAEMTLADKFRATFLAENRWQMFAQGILVTLKILVLSVLFGTVLGFAVYLLTRNGNGAANAVTNFCKGVIQGFPMVVLLMILFYVVFSRTGISAEWVAVIGFTMTFACAVHGLLDMGGKTVDPGQTEAAYSLGYSNMRTFFRFILPQIITRILPSYKDEIVNHIKATAIVGYISVVDVTKVGDIIRGRTYEAFLPLIAVSLIYFLMAFLMKLLLDLLAKKLDTRRRKEIRILKGLEKK